MTTIPENIRFAFNMVYWINQPAKLSFYVDTTPPPCYWDKWKMATISLSRHAPEYQADLLVSNYRNACTLHQRLPGYEH